MPIPIELAPALRNIVRQMVDGNYVALAAGGQLKRGTSEQLRGVVLEYGRTLIDLPDNAFQIGDAFPIRGEEATWKIDLPLWTKEEGLSDLTLQLTVRLTENGIEAEIDDLHVL